MKRILMEPQPLWEEEPYKDPQGFWCGRYECYFGNPGKINVEIEVDVHKPPNINAKPIQENKKWYWEINNRRSIMNTICKNCIFWKRKKVHSYYRKYFVTGNPEKIYEEYEEYRGIPPWGTSIKQKDLGNLPQNIGSCNCDKFIYDSPDTPNPHKISYQNKGALYYCDGEEYSCWFYTGENFGCIYFKENNDNQKHG